MTTHGRGLVGRFWLGSVADQLIRELPVPLLLVRPQAGKVDMNREVVLSRMVIPLDGSPLAEHVIEPAIALGGFMGAEYTFLRVVRSLALPPMTDFVPPATSKEGQSLLQKLEKLQAEEVQSAGDYLKHLEQSFTAVGRRIRTKVVTAEQPVAAILEEATPAGNDCIALATHGRSGLRRMILGSVADKVIRSASVPVLVYRPRDK
jgi:nucleotide-binding universal stress UspA family protein